MPLVHSTSHTTCNPACLLLLYATISCHVCKPNIQEPHLPKEAWLSSLKNAQRLTTSWWALQAYRCRRLLASIPFLNQMFLILHNILSPSAHPHVPFQQALQWPTHSSICHFMPHSFCRSRIVSEVTHLRLLKSFRLHTLQTPPTPHHRLQSTPNQMTASNDFSQPIRSYGLPILNQPPHITTKHRHPLRKPLAPTTTSSAGCDPATCPLLLDIGTQVRHLFKSPQPTAHI